MTVTLETSQALSECGKRRMLATEGGAFMLADWARAVFMHFEFDPSVLQPQVPFELDLRDGKAYVSLVAFEMMGFRMRTGGRFVRWLFRPISDHGFLNVRTYEVGLRQRYDVRPRKSLGRPAVLGARVEVPAHHRGGRTATASRDRAGVDAGNV